MCDCIKLINVADVKRLVEADRRISISCITHELEISTGTVSRIMNDFFLVYPVFLHDGSHIVSPMHNETIEWSGANKCLGNFKF